MALKRSVFFCMLAFLAGVYAAYFIPNAICVAPLLFAALFLLVLACFQKCPLSYFFILVFFLTGAIYFSQVDRPERNPLYPYLDEYVTVTADVISDAEKNETTGDMTFTARVRQLSFLKEEISLKENVRMSLPAGEPVPKFGESFQAICRLSLPEDFSDDDGFDYALYLKSKKISFLGDIERGSCKEAGTFSLSLTERLYVINRSCGKSISALLPKDAADLVKAVSLGDTTAMSDELQQSLAFSGLSHMTAVSGMHVTILISVLYMLPSILKRNKHKYILPIVSLILLFMLFTGASPSVVRAAIMSIVSLVAVFFCRRADGITSLGVAAGLIVAINPFSAFNIGFMLSFGATMGILLFAKPLEERVLTLFRLTNCENPVLRILSSIFSLLCVSFSAQILILPIVSRVFGYTSLWGFITNLLTAVLLPFILVAGLFIGFLGLLHPWLAWPVAGFVYPFAKVFLAIASGFGRLEFGVVKISALGPFGFYVYSLVLYGFYQLLKRRYRKMSVSLLSVLMLLLVYAMTLVFGNLADIFQSCSI